MKGVKTISVKINYLTYNLEFDRNVSIICGNSGTGKTTLLHWINEGLKNRKSGVKITSNCVVDVLDERSDWRKLLSGAKNTVFFADESVEYIQTSAFRELVYLTGVYIVIMTRSYYLLGYDYSINSIYTLKSEKNGDYVTTVVEPRFVNSVEAIKPDIIVTEDSKSGKQMYESLGICNVIPARGKGSIQQKVLELDNGINNIYIVVDGAVFGCEMMRMVSVLSKRIKLFAPESFEYLLLHCEPFKRRVWDILESPVDYVDFSKYISYERFFTDLLENTAKELGTSYSKAHLSGYFKTDSIKSQFRSLLKDIEEV